MKRYEFRIQGTERCIYSIDELHLEAPLIDRDIIFANVSEEDKKLKYEIYDRLLGKVIYREGEKKNTVVLNEEQQEMLIDLCILPNAEEKFEELAQLTEKNDSLAPEVREHQKKQHLRNMRKIKKMTAEQWRVFEDSFKE